MEHVQRVCEVKYLLEKEIIKPFVGQVSERRLRTLSFCAFKLRNLETSHRDNATLSAYVGRLYPSRCYIVNVYHPIVNIITWRGLAALLILDWGQCEGLNAGMGRCSYSHAFFYFRRLP